MNASVLRFLVFTLSLIGVVTLVLPSFGELLHFLLVCVLVSQFVFLSVIAKLYGERGTNV